MADLGRLEKVDLRKAWKSEADDFTPWLAQEKNLQLLGETLGMQLELVQQEKAVGRFVADILCRDTSEEGDSWVLIENQLERTDHSHLGQLLTYAAGLEARTVVWISPEFTEEHRAALDWLNEHTDESISFLGLEVEIWRIGDSPIAPKFNIVAKPNDWSREVRTSARRAGMTEHRQLQLEYWQRYREFVADSKVPTAAARATNSIVHPLGDSRTSLYAVASMYRSGSPTQIPELRVEFGVQMDDPQPTFAWFEERKAEIEKALGAKLTWDQETYKGYCRAYLAKEADMREREQWPAQHKWLRQYAEKFHDVFLPLVKEYQATQR